MTRASWPFFGGFFQKKTWVEAAERSVA